MNKRGPALTAKSDLQRRLMWLIVLSMSVPSFLLGAAVFLQGPLESVLGDITDDGRDELLLGLVVLTPILLSAVIVWAYVQTNRIVGPVERIITALDARIEGKGSGSIVLRKQDLLAPLAERINIVVAKWESLKNTERL